MTLKVH